MLVSRTKPSSTPLLSMSAFPLQLVCLASIWHDVFLTHSTDHLIVDTGSSNTWVGAVNEYIPTNSSTFTGQLLVR